MRLPGSENWDEERVREHILFLEAVSRSIPSLVAEIASHAYNGDPERMAARPNDALFAITEAAELAFAIGDVELGLEYARDAAARLGAGDRQIFTPMQALLAATLGALANSLDVVWNGDGSARIFR